MVVGAVDEVADAQSVGGFLLCGSLDLPIPNGPIGEQLEALGTGPGAISYLNAIETKTLDADERIAYLQAWERQQGWLAEQTQIALLAVAGQEPEPDMVGGRRSFERDDWARDEIAAALGVSTRTAGSRVHTARLLDRCLPSTQALLGAGAISWRHVQALIDECAGLPDETVRAVEARVIERAPRQTAANFRRSVRRAVLALADVCGQLAEAVTKTQRAVWLTPETDGMATLSAFLPAIEAHAAYALLTQAANQLPTTKPGPPGAAGPSVPDATGEQPMTGAGATRTAAPGWNLDQRRADALLAMLGVDIGTARHTIRTGRAGRRRWRPRVRIDMQVVIDAITLAGLTDTPAELRGYGPISARAARALFANMIDDVTMRRLVTDPITGHLLDYGRRTYRIPKPLADYVRARDRHCRFPGCLRPISTCDIDHVIPWNQGGRTTATNCACLCRRHHRLKTHAGWTLQLHPDASCHWTSPTGQHYDLPAPTQLDQPALHTTPAQPPKHAQLDLLNEPDPPHPPEMPDDTDMPDRDQRCPPT
jgi:hypothetical protein